MEFASYVTHTLNSGKNMTQLYSFYELNSKAGCSALSCGEASILLPCITSNTHQLRGTPTYHPLPYHLLPPLLCFDPSVEAVYCYLFPSVTSHCCYYCIVIIIFVPATHLGRKALRTLITLWPDMELYF